MARLLASLLLSAISAASALAQTDTRPSFAVATIKKNTTGGDAQSMRLQPGGRLLITNKPLRRLVLFASTSWRRPRAFCRRRRPADRLEHRS
jgi:hypothetical protein